MTPLFLSSPRLVTARPWAPQSLAKPAAWAKPAVTLSKFESSQFGSSHPVTVLSRKSIIAGACGVILGAVGLVGSDAYFKATVPMPVKITAETIASSLNALDDEPEMAQTGKTLGIMVNQLESHFRSVGYNDKGLSPDLKTALDMMELDAQDKRELREITDAVETIGQRSGTAALREVQAHYHVFADKILARHLPVEQVAQYKAAADDILSRCSRQQRVDNVLILLMLASLLQAVGSGVFLGVMGKRLDRRLYY